jgi:hypothetical protein
LKLTRAILFSVPITLLSPTGAVNVEICRFAFPCVVKAVKGYRVGGTGATVNAGKGTTATPTNSLLASDLSITSTETWMDGGAVQNTAFSAGDPLIAELTSVAGAPSQVAIQVDFSRGA